MRVLVATTCAPDDRKTLSVVRSISRAGAAVTVGGDRHLGRAFHSKHVGARILYPHPGCDPDGFLISLRGHLERTAHDVVIPTSDYTTLALARFASELAPVGKILAPDFDAARLAGDKLALLGEAERLGIEVPVTRFLDDGADLDSIARDLGWPVVVKPRRGMGGIGVNVAENTRELQECRRRRLPLVDEVFDLDSLLVQQWVPGRVHDVCVLFNRGEPKAAMTQRRLLMYPQDGGPGIYNETTDEPELRERAIGLLREIGWHGPAQVEFKVDPSSGDAKLIEVNGRFWGTLDLAVAAGIDFPVLAAELAVRGDIEPVFDYRVGLRFRWPIPFAILHALHGPGDWSSLWSLVRPDRDVRSDLYLGDPLPWLSETAFALRRLLLRSTRKARRGDLADPAAPGAPSDLSRLRSLVRTRHSE